MCVCVCDNYIKLGKTVSIFHIIVFRITIGISDLFKHFIIFRSVRYICVFRSDEINDCMRASQMLGLIKYSRMRLVRKQLWEMYEWDRKENSETCLHATRVYESISLWKTYMCVRWSRIIGINIDLALFLK